MQMKLLVPLILISTSQGCKMNSSPATIVEQYRKPLAASLLKAPGWTESDYSLKPVSSWASDKVKLIAATHKEERNGPFPFFAIMSDGTLVSNYDENAFQTIVQKEFTDLSEAQAPTVARLGVLFGGFAPKVVGEFSDQVPKDSGLVPPRTTADVEYSLKDGVHILRFYTRDFELNISYDCIIEISNGVVKASAQALSKPVTDSDAN